MTWGGPQKCQCQAAVLAWLEERTATEEGQEIGPKRRGPGDLWKGWNGTESRLGGGFKICLLILFIFTPNPREMIQFDEYFSNGLKPPPSRSKFQH